MYAHTYMHACTYVCTHIYIHTYMHACTYVHMYTHTHTHRQTHTQSTLISSNSVVTNVTTLLESINNRILLLLAKATLTLCLRYDILNIMPTPTSTLNDYANRKHMRKLVKHHYHKILNTIQRVFIESTNSCKIIISAAQNLVNERVR